jgi:outer membrane receptor protein involved in Fe transport
VEAQASLGEASSFVLVEDRAAIEPALGRLRGLEAGRATLVDLSASYRLPIGDEGRRYIEAQLSVNNILDERYIAGILDEFNQRYTVGAPRSVHFTLSVGF